MNITDPRRKWVPAVNTDIRDTWKKHGFKPTTEAERRARQERQSATVTSITKKRKA